MKNVPKTIVIGAKGFIGKNFYNFYSSLFPDAIGTHHSSSDVYEKLDLHDFSLDFLQGKNFSYAIIAAGISDLRLCEKQPHLTRRINVENTLALAKALENKKIVPILFSSDYVFEGGDIPYTVDSPKSPLNQYGLEKAELERRVRKDLSRYCLIRTTKLYGTTRGDNTIFDQIAHSLAWDMEVKAATDQILCPIHIQEVVKHVVAIQQEKKFGLFNFSSRENASRYEYAQFIAQVLKKAHLVKPMLIDELQDGVRRPKKVFIECSRTFSSAFENIRYLLKQYQKNEAVSLQKEEIFL